MNELPALAGSRVRIKALIRSGFAAIFATTGLAWLWDSMFAKRGIRILAYHGIETPVSNPFCVSVERFEEQMAYVARHFEVIDLDTTLKWLDGSYDSGKRKLVITFDDGFRNNFSQAAPILKKYGLPATFFIIASKLDGGDDRFMMTSDAVQLLECELFRVGSHSHNHRSMAQISEDDRTEEMGGSKALLELRLARSVRHFCYPYGTFNDFDRRSIASVQRHGYALACTAVNGVNFKTTDRFRLRRTKVEWSDDIKTFKRALYGALDAWILVDYFFRFLQRPRAVRFERQDRPGGDPLRAALAASHPLISVIVPHLNQAEQLHRCLQSLRRQTYSVERFEIIVVDNGSKVLPAAVVSEYPNAKLEREGTPGPGPARNRGVAVARGKVLAFIDADCIADQDWLASIASALGEVKIRRAIGGDVRIAVADPKRFTQLEAYESIFAYRQEEYIRKFGFSGTGNLAVRREDFETVGPFAGIAVAEDRDWGRRAKASGLEIGYVPEMIVYHPARTTFVELYEKWARHIDHDAEDYARRRFRRVRWFTYAVAVALSPAFELPRIINSARVPTLRERRLAAAALIRIRFYRARKMIAHAVTIDPNKASRSWNRT